MADELRDRVLAAVRKGLAGPLDTSKTKQPVLHGYRADSAIENGVTSQAARNTTFPNQTKDVTPLHQLSANSDSQPETVCVQCGAREDLWHLDTTTGPVPIHPECFEFLPRPQAAEPSAAYRGVTGAPDGAGAEVTIVRLPGTGERYWRTFGRLQLKPPEMVDVDRWRRCIEHGRAFLHEWGETAQRLNWSSRDLFGLNAGAAPCQAELQQVIALRPNWIVLDVGGPRQGRCLNQRGCRDPHLNRRDTYLLPAWSTGVRARGR